MSRARTLLVAVDDRFLDGLEEWINQLGEIEVVGRAHSGLEALDSMVSLRPELIVVDVTLPDISGFEVTRRIKADTSTPSVVLLSFHDSQAVRQEALAVGADAFVGKSETVDRLLPVAADLLRRRNSSVRKAVPVLSRRETTFPEAAR